MPQMAPYNWLIMMFIINIITYNIMCHNHFLYTPTMNKFIPPFKVKSHKFKNLW